MAVSSSRWLLGSGTTVLSMLLCSRAKHLCWTDGGESSDLWYPQCNVPMGEIGDLRNDEGDACYWPKGQFGQGFSAIKNDGTYYHHTEVAVKYTSPHLSVFSWDKCSASSKSGLILQHREPMAS